MRFDRAIGLAGLIGFALAATQAAAETASAAAMPMVQQLSPNLAVLIGSSSNVLIAPGPDGVLLVDPQRASDLKETLAGVSQVSQAPVRYVIDTHWHLDHSGANGAFAEKGATIIAQRNVRVRRSTEQFMVAYNAHIPAAPESALPTVIFDKSLKLHQGQETITLRHVANAHTDGDSLVRFAKANVIAMGDVYFNGIFPFIDRSSGGSIQGMVRGVDKALSMANDRTRIVPAHGPIASKADLIAYRAMLADVAKQVRGSKRAGKSLAEVIAAHPAAAYRSGMEGNEDHFVEAIYDSYPR